jgi:hypothetical protein
VGTSGKAQRYIVQKVGGGRDDSGVGLFVGTVPGRCIIPTPWWFVEQASAHGFSDRIAAQAAADVLEELGHKTELLLIPVAGIK